MIARRVSKLNICRLRILHCLCQQREPLHGAQKATGAYNKRLKFPGGIQHREVLTRNHEVESSSGKSGGIGRREPRYVRGFHCCAHRARTVQPLPLGVNLKFSCSQGFLVFACTWKCGRRSKCTHTMRMRTCVSVVVCVACKLRPCPSFSGCRDRNNSLHSLYKGEGGYQIRLGQCMASGWVRPCRIEKLLALSKRQTYMPSHSCSTVVPQACGPATSSSQWPRRSIIGLDISQQYYRTAQSGTTQP